MGQNFLACQLEDAVPAFGANIVRLTDGPTFHIVACQTGDANIESYVMIEDGADIFLAQFAPLEDPDSALRVTLSSPSWRADQGVLTAVQYDSPNYDCGTFETFVYDREARDFRRTQLRRKTSCDGVAASPETFPLAADP